MVQGFADDGISAMLVPAQGAKAPTQFIPFVENPAWLGSYLLWLSHRPLARDRFYS